MFERPQTIRQATELWVERRLYAINLDIIARLMKYEPDKWCEVTVPAVGDMVFVHKMDLSGEVIEHAEKSGDYRIQFISDAKIYARTGNTTKGSLRGKRCGFRICSSLIYLLMFGIRHYRN